MSKLPVVSGRETVSALTRIGFTIDRQKGSHIILYRPKPPTTVSVPDHRELDRGTLRAILRQADISPEEFHKLL